MCPEDIINLILLWFDQEGIIKFNFAGIPTATCTQSIQNEYELKIHKANKGRKKKKSHRIHTSTSPSLQPTQNFQASFQSLISLPLQTWGTDIFRRLQWFQELRLDYLDSMQFPSVHFSLFQGFLSPSSVWLLVAQSQPEPEEEKKKNVWIELSRMKQNTLSFMSISEQKHK